MCYIVAKKIASKVTNYIHFMSKTILGYLVFWKVDVGNCFGVTFFGKLKLILDFDLGFWGNLNLIMNFDQGFRI